VTEPPILSLSLPVSPRPVKSGSLELTWLYMPKIENRRSFDWPQNSLGCHRYLARLKLYSKRSVSIVPLPVDDTDVPARP